MDEIALLRRLDEDAAAESPDAKHAARSALRAHIAAQQIAAPAHRDVVPRVSARPRWPRLRLVAAIAAVVVVAAVAAVVLPGRGSRPAYAATPPLLMPVSDQGRPAERVLERLAAAAEEQPALADGRYHYLKAAGWGLHTAVYDEDHVESVIVPGITEQWIADDGSGLQIHASGEPVEAGPPGADADRRAIDDLPDGEGEITEFAPGEMWVPPIASLPRDPVALRDKLLVNPGDGGPCDANSDVYDPETCDRPESVQLYVALEELHVERVPPDLLATFYRALAEEPDLRAYGQITDRAGRRAIAVGFDSDYAGLPTRHMMIVDPDTGTLLGLEEILTTDPGKLNVRVPAVISYIVYLAGGNVASTDERAPRIP
jgi:hypothetical protein